jgi:quercetin dioxygenase-like cupin family protein
MPFLRLENITEKEPMPGFRARFVHSENMTFAFWDIKEGAELPEHAHHHEQVAKMLEGQFELTVDGESQLMEPGMVAVIPANVAHSGRAIADCKIIDTFYPVREDYL